MGIKGDISPCKKAEVKALVNAKLFSNREISRRLKVSEASVRRIRKKIEPKKKEKMRQKAYFHPKTYRPARKPKLTSAMKAKRLNWAKQWHDKDVDFWRSDVVIIYSQTKSASVRKAHLKFSGTKLSLSVLVVEKSFILTALFRLKHPTKIMIWSVIFGKGTGRLYVVKGMMRQDQYKDVLQNRLIPQLEQWFPNGEPYIFMQDGAPCHTARYIKAFWQNKISLC
ncbi:uncharacterized protein TNCV_2597761 [Trichonephila clavipes]|nr:uncharacterized protein TNCV_2597761 [Trichonephila clavipes]